MWTEPAVFVVSTGRTGTHFLAECLPKALDGVYARHEPAPDLLELGRSFRSGRLSARRATRELARSRAAEFEAARRAGCDVYLESNLHLSMLIPLLRDVFPQRRVVRIVRDGRDYVRSAFSKRTRARDGGTTFFMAEDDARTRLSPSDLPGDPWLEHWHDFDRFERVVWHWAALDRLALDAVEADPLALTLRYEDLFDPDRGPDRLRHVVDFLGLAPRLRVDDDALAEMLRGRADATQRFELPHWSEWPDGLRERFDAIAGAHMVRCGYAGG